MATFIPTDPIGFPNVTFGLRTQSLRVQPGDLITAEFMNAILARLDEIEARLTRIEDGLGGTPTFTLPTTVTMQTVTFHTFPTGITAATGITVATHATSRPPTVLTPTRRPTTDFETFVATWFRPPEEEIELDPGTVMVGANKGIFPPEAEVTSLPGIGVKERELLDKVNIKNVKDFSAMDVKVLSETLKMPMEEAKTLLGMANNVVIKDQIKQR